MFYKNKFINNKKMLWGKHNQSTIWTHHMHDKKYHAMICFCFLYDKIVNKTPINNLQTYQTERSKEDRSNCGEPEIGYVAL